MEAAHTDGATLVQGSTKGAGLQGGEVEPLVRYVDVPELGVRSRLRARSRWGAIEPDR